MTWVDQTKRNFAAVRMIAYIIAGVVTIFCIGMLTSLYAHALEDSSPSWLAGTPSFLSETESIRQTGVVNDCTPTYVTVAGGSQGGYKCLVQGEDVAIDDNLTSISIGLDKKQYKVNGMGPVISEYSRRNFVPSSNMLITRSGYTFVTYSATLTIESNVLKSLRPVIGPTLAREYNYAYSPDFILSDGSGPLNVARGLGYSQNGRWIVVEVMNLGLVRIDTQNNYRAELFSTLAPRYYVASNPQMALAISDDGSHAAVGGMNSPFLVYEISNTCTKVIDPDLIFSRDGYVGCPEKSLWEYKGSDQYSPYRLKFDADGYELKFVDSITHWSNCSGILQTRCEAWRTLRAPGYSDESKLDYLALGDSYSSGEGDVEKNDFGHKYYRDYTDNEEQKKTGQPREKCHISTRSYPYLLARGMELALDNPRQWNTVACSGATTWDAKMQSSDKYEGQGKGARNDNSPRLRGFDTHALKLQAINEMIPGRQKQLEFVKLYKPRVITLTMGGNDIGFGDKIKTCVMAADTCKFAQSQGRTQLAKEILDQFDNLKAFYEELYKASDSKAKIYVVGYPQFINGSKEASCPANIGMLNSEEREMMKNGVVYINKVIKQAAEAAGVKYLDVENSLEGHRLCDKGESYVTGVAMWGSSELQESFHPNFRGHQAIALSIWNDKNVSGESLLDYTICSDGGRMCPNYGATKDNIERPVYFAGDSSYVKTNYRSDLILGGVHKDSLMNLSTGPYSFTPGSTAKLTLYSEPTELGEYTVDSNGSVSVAIAIPSSISAGYHTLAVEGVAYSGETVALEQIIFVAGNDPSDIDDNGVIDSEQACLFLQPVNEDVDGDGIDDACDPYIGDTLVAKRDTMTIAAATSYTSNMGYSGGGLGTGGTRVSAPNGFLSDERGAYKDSNQIDLPPRSMLVEIFIGLAAIVIIVGTVLLIRRPRLE